jgi:hypothetical protein
LIGDERYDLAIDLRLYEDTRLLLTAIDARHKSGFDPYREFAWLTIPMHPLLPTLHGRAEVRLIPSSEFNTRHGEHLHYAITFRGGVLRRDAGNLVWGPYTTLSPGHYELEVLVDPLAEGFELGYDLPCNDGQDILAGGVLRVERDRFPKLSLHPTEPIRRLEFRLIATTSEALPPFRFMGLRWKRHGAFIGMHQRESMALLAHLVVLRLQFPYTVAYA